MLGNGSRAVARKGESQQDSFPLAGAHTQIDGDLPSHLCEEVWAPLEQGVLCLFSKSNV
jgi:hypothetical protein